MKKVVAIVRSSILYFFAIFLVAMYPFAVMAETAPVDPIPSATNSSSPPATTDPLVVNTAPTSSTPTVDAAPTADVPTVPSPDTSNTVTPTPAPKPTYTYNSGTGRWDSNKWQYNPATGAYTPVPPPAPVIIQPPAPVTGPVSLTDPATTSVSTTQVAAALDSNTLATLANALDSNATTGNATVSQNTTAGNATTGSATAATTILNNVNSSLSNSNNQKAANFVSNITGDVNGDIVLQPMLLKAMLESGASNPTSSIATVNNTSQLTNNVNLAATSGNAGVTGNTNAGSATTGSANTVANVMNIINSMVAANQSFVGTINIYGSLNGDILVAPGFIPQLLASNSGGTSSGSTSSNTPSIVNVNDTQSIVNNVALAAASGSAAVLNNTSAGNSTTGNANTNVVIFNLSGHQIVASNSLLVFVNVLGKWVGVIVDAPTGATAAAIGNGVTANNMVAPDLIVNATNNSQIINNINLNSTSGSALVAGNTSAGNATSGNATASANIANISGSQFGLSGWFGVLFINVFGSWYGSFGIDTSAGNPPTINDTDLTQPVKVIDFIPRTAFSQPLRTSHKVTIINSSSDGSSPSVIELQPQEGTVMGASTLNNTKPQVAALPRVDFRLPIVVGATFLIGISGLGLRRILFTSKDSFPA